MRDTAMGPGLWTRAVNAVANLQGLDAAGGP